MYQNTLTQKYKTHLEQPIQFMNNQLLNNNPIYSSNIYDQNFYQQMMLQKEEQIRKIKNISELGMTKDKITEYIIAPIKVEKSDRNEISRMISDEEEHMTDEYIKQNWWVQRTNAPYKNILKDQDWQKPFKTESDLIVHKYTDLDKIGLMKEYDILNHMIEKHNGDLKVVFSASKESEHKKAFKFVQKYRKRMKYDPKDYREMKNYYHQEQKKFDREHKRLDNIISRIMDDDISDTELKQIEMEHIEQTNIKKSNSALKEKNIDKQLQELINEFGEDVLKELQSDSDENIENNASSDKKNQELHKKETLGVLKMTNPENTKSRVRIVRKNITDIKENNYPIEMVSDVFNNKTKKPENYDQTEKKRIRIKRVVKNEENDNQEQTAEHPDNNSERKTNSVDSLNVRRVKIVRKSHVS